MLGNYFFFMVPLEAAVFARKRDVEASQLPFLACFSRAWRRFIACKKPFSREVSFGLDSPIASWARCFASSMNLSPLSKPI